MRRLLWTATMVAACAAPAFAQTTVGRVEGTPSAHSGGAEGHRYGAQVQPVHVVVPSTYAGVSAFRVRLPWGGHVNVPGVHVRSPRVAVTSPHVGVNAPGKAHH